MSRKLGLGFLIVFIIYLIGSNTLNNLISPIISNCIYVCLPILVLFFISEFRETKINKKMSIIFLLPIIFGIIGCNASFSKTYTLAKAQRKIDYNASQEKNVEDETENVENLIEENGKVIEMTDENYIETLNMVYTNLDEYIGTTIKVTGCTFKDETCEYNQIAAGKYYMYCCAADMALSGFLFQYDTNEFKIEENKWYEFEAIIKKHTITLNGQTIEEPVLIIKKANEISEPNQTRVYYNY